MKQFLISQLQKAAKRAIDTHQPTVVAITGSYGKTSTREAVARVLATKYRVRTAEKNYNNEIGVPLTILGEENPGRSVRKWLSLLWRTRNVREMPEMLVLEYGADHPGDIQALCALAKPDVGVLTGISPVHAEFFDDIEALSREKAHLVQSVSEDGLAVTNADDDGVERVAEALTVPLRRYGTNETADIQAASISLSTRRDDDFDPGEVFAITQAEVLVGTRPVGTLNLENSIGYAPVMSCLAALAVGDHFSVSFADGIEALNASMQAMPGRLNPLPGIKGSLIIDDSYNAAPAAMQHGLDVLSHFDPGEDRDRRIAVLGGMAELGQYSENEHRAIGKRVAEVADVFIAVGSRMQVATEEAERAGMSQDHIHWFATSQEAGRFLDAHLQQGDVVYVKGSQSSRMEHVVKDVMAEPARAKELLVRQGSAWMK